MKIQEAIPNDFSTRNLVGTRSIQPEEKYWISKQETESTTSFFSSTTEKKNMYEIPYKYSQSRHMMRLANAKDVTSVRGVIAASQSEMGILKLRGCIRKNDCFERNVWRKNEKRLRWNVSWQSSSAKKDCPQSAGTLSDSLIR